MSNPSKNEKSKIKLDSLNPCKNPCLENDDKDESGVLLSDEIMRHVDKFGLILNFQEKNLKSAGYELRVGKKYAIEGVIKKLTKGKELTIDPFQCVIVSTIEKINMPRFLIARWNLRVEWVYKGLLWLGAPQVDPGYCGRLFCPIFNLSSSPVKLKLREPLALIDFVKTTKFNEKKSMKYERPPSRTKIEDYNTELQSALFTEVGKRMNKMERKIDNVIIANMSALSLIIAVLAIFIGVADLQLNFELFTLLNFISLGTAITALIISICFLISRKK